MGSSPFGEQHEWAMRELCDYEERGSDLGRSNRSRSEVLTRSMIVSRSDRRVQDCEPWRRLCFSVAKLGGSCIDFIRGVQQGRSESLARRHDENQGEADQRENRSICSHTVVLSAAKSAVICFEWLQRPENVVAGHIKWTGYRTGSKPTIRIEHHKTGAVIDHPLESGVLVGR